MPASICASRGLFKMEKVREKINLVYGGGSVGLMGLISQAVYDGVFNVFGIIPMMRNAGCLRGAGANVHFGGPVDNHQLPRRRHRCSPPRRRCRPPPGAACQPVLPPLLLPIHLLSPSVFQGREGRFSIYVHASRETPVHTSRLFIGRDIHSEKVIWGKISMVDAEKRLLGHALIDVDNQYFVLLSDSCVPLHSFDYVYDYLMGTNISFIDCFEDPGPHGSFRYSNHMLPEVRKDEFRKGSQWFSIKRQHAVLILADNLYYTKFKLHCKPGMENGRNCYADEHYLPTLFNMVDPTGVSNWSITHVDWSEGKWHPKAYRAQDVTYELIKNISSIDENYHVTSNEKKVVMRKPCMWNGVKRPCYLFARKFYPEALDKLMQLYPNITRN